MTPRKPPKYQLLGKLRPEEYAALRTDIEKRGVMVPVEVDENGEILDGHHRAEIADALGLKYKTIVRRGWDEAQKRRHVYKLNLARRQWNDVEWVSAFDAAAEEYGVSTGRGANQGEHSVSLSECAKEFGVTVKTVHNRKKRAAEYLALPDDQRTAIDDSGDPSKARREAVREERKAANLADRKKRAKVAAKDVAGKDYGVHHGRFQDGMADLADESVDLIFTDPPYDRKSLPMYGDLAEIAARVLVPGGSLITYLGQYAMPQVIGYLSEHLTFRWTLACVHTGQCARMSLIGIVVKWKPLLWYVKGKNRRDTLTFVDDLVESEPEKDAHEWQQGTIEAEYYIEKLTMPGDLVVDPFCGGGTTAVAAKRLGRKWKTYETDDKSVAIARKRIKDNAER